MEGKILYTVLVYIHTVIELTNVIRANKTVGLDRDVFTYIADLSEETTDPFNDVLNKLCRDGIAAREEQEDQ